MNAGGAALTTTLGNFSADQYFSGGSTASAASGVGIAGTSDPALYQSERTGSFTYALPVANGSYTVVLHFAELTFTRNNQRVFDVNAEGKKVLANYDIARKVGALTATTERLTVGVTDGALTLAFIAGKASVPKVSAIEVLSTSVQPCTLPAPSVTAPSAYCVGSTAALLSSHVTLSAGATLLIYPSATQGSPIPDFRPATTTAGTSTYYVAQVANGCESGRTAISVTVNSVAPPAVTSPLTYTQGATPAPLSSSVLLAAGGALRIYDGPSAGTALPATFQPPTSTVGSVTYYVAQVVNGCESNRQALVVTVTAGPTTPPTSSTYTITATYTTLPALRTASYALLKYNKRIGLQLTDDDGGKVDVTCIPQVLHGGTAANGVTYPGISYTDGTGRSLRPGFTFAVSTLINGQPGRDGAPNAAYATWAELQPLRAQRTIGFSNHSANHGPDYPATQLADADATFLQKLDLIPRTVTIPGGFPGFVAATIADAKKLAVISQGYGSNGESADGHFSEVRYLDKVSVPYDPPTILILTRYFLNQDWGAPARAWVDEKFQLATDEYNAGRRVMLSAFDHFPESQTANLAAFYAYVQNHPLNVGGDNVWFANLQEFAEYEEVKKKCPISAPVVSGNTLTWTIDKSALPSYSLYQDASLLIPAGGLQNVSVSGGDSFTANLATGLVNIAKLNAATLTATRAATGAVRSTSARTQATAAARPTPGETAAEVTIYPNPATKIATVAFTLPAAERYSVHLYNNKGVLVERIASGQGPAGAQYSYGISSSKLPAGTYMVHLVMGTTSKKFRLNVGP
ncbi:T9SS type A sorting domain-containing protein [Hymenobacter sp. BT186]|uniref:T9SS type A sorting domain-containing protein n=1 Tax=Hymenobacter telluris TaxID=2816474 RepID=A0A939EWN8_9BACT|nr:malectin domain-containing carbohydrate-binding protein [Hymenobacter telluris]MBO0358546.1 T9SS type A sorting domain-containing protein [Hymenobacter telluris]MBW3374572.1 T9SS type A sorting domain-containing protein [Hymenobacter norwichensis]